jgi:ubiquitin C-terminal hydrolase
MFKVFEAFHNCLLDSQIQCERCGHVSKTEGNNERHLSIPIKPRRPGSQLTSYIDNYMDEVVSGYRCENEKCKHVSDKHRVQKIAAAPDVLYIQLKRFDFQGKKDESTVNYRTMLDLTKYRASADQGELWYRLMAVVCHAGTANFGHYTCTARGPDGKFHEFDDAQVSRASDQDACKPGAGFTPYLLFYSRVGAPKK